MNRIFRSFKSLVVKDVLIKAKLFTSILTNINDFTLYLLRNKVYKTIKYLSFIS